MKLRVRINKQTYRVELDNGGDGASLTELSLRIREVLLPSQGLSPDTEFILSLNGQEPLSDTGQTLSSAGIVSGDLICAILPQSLALPRTPSPCSAATQSPSTSASLAAPQRQPYATHFHEPDLSTAATSTNTKGSEQMDGSTADREEKEEGRGALSQDPMLCSEAVDGQVPLSLELLHLGARGGGPCDRVMVVAHLLMLETGFMSQESGLRPGEMPSRWRSPGGAYKLQYTHPLCEDSLIMVIGVSMGPMLVINATLNVKEKVETVRKLCLEPSSNVEAVPPEAAAAMVYKDLAKLSRTFKDQLAYPLIAATRAAMSLPPAFGLCVLPPELLLRVLRLLDTPSLVAVSAVSRRLRCAATDSTLWRHLYVRDFGGQDPSASATTDWKELYTRKYKALQHYRRAASRPPYWLPTPVYPVVPGPQPFHPQPFPQYPPGIIGGEFDQRPDIPLGLLPRPRYDPLGPFPGGLPGTGPSRRRGGPGPIGGGGRARDIRRGFI